MTPDLGIFNWIGSFKQSVYGARERLGFDDMVSQ